MEKGKPILIDSKVLGEIMRTHSPACLMAAAEILAAAGCDEKGEVVPLTANGKRARIHPTASDGFIILACLPGERISDADLIKAGGNPNEGPRLLAALGVPEPTRTCATCDMRDVCRVTPDRCSNWEPRHD